MPTYAVTGATGHLGRLVVESLLSRGVPARDITARGGKRDMSTKIKDLADTRRPGPPGHRLRRPGDPRRRLFRRAPRRILLISASAT